MNSNIDATHSWGPRLRTTVLLALMTATMWLVPTGAAPDDRSSVDATRDVLQRWVDTRQLISTERRDWKLGRELLEDRIDMVRAEVDELRAKINADETKIDDTNREVVEFEGEVAALEQATAGLGTVIGSLEAETLDLLKRVPQIMIDRTRTYAQEIPENPAASDLPLSTRYMNVVAVLIALDRFNSEITFENELRTFEDGTSSEVSVLYVGLGYAYYVTQNETRAGVGASTPEGWVWKESNASAASIAEAIRVYNNEKPAAFVRLPIRID